MSELVTIAEYGDLAAAYVARSKLEDAGIHCLLANEHTVGINWGYLNAVGGVRLNVFEPDTARAAELLGIHGEQVVTVSRKASKEICPRCGAAAVTKRGFWAALATLFLLGMPLIRTTYHCKQCGHSWR